MPVTETVYNVYSDQFVEMNKQLIHVSAQMDIINHSLYISNTMLSFVGVVVALLGALAMYTLGHKITSK
jgi:hypothetical protein